MQTISFYNLNCWKSAHKLTLDIYRITKTYPKEEVFGITNQIRRAASSVSANIAEGQGRYHYKDKKRFYYQARGSLLEVHSFLILSKDLHFINKQDFLVTSNQLTTLLKQINALIKSTTSQ